MGLRKLVYKITDFELVDDKFQVFREMPDLEEVEEHGKKTYVDILTRKEYIKSNLWYLTTVKPLNAISHDEKYIPYIADVVEDLPGYLNLEPRKYRNCQLMTEKHGAYMQFYFKPSNEVLRIAMNSNIYQRPNIVKVGLKQNAVFLYAQTNGNNHCGHTDLPNHSSVINLDEQEFDNFINLISKFGFNASKSLTKNPKKKHGNCDYSCYLVK